MTTKPKVKKFRIRRKTPDEQAQAAAGAEAVEDVKEPSHAEQIAAISKEGLTGRQLRMARRVAMKNGFEASSDYDAVRQLRAAGIDPFQRSSVLELVKPDSTKVPGKRGRIQLPDTRQDEGISLPSTNNQTALNRNAAEILQIQRDIAARRKRKLALLFTRLSFFVLLPTFLIGWYFYNIATPMYATNSEIVIQQAQQQGGGPQGLATLFQGTSMATQQDSIAVQSYLASREAMLRLDGDHGFKSHFANPEIDSIQRLEEGATNEQAFDLYKDHVKISYDPTEGLIRMEVIAADPVKSYDFSQALIGYAEEQVDQLTGRLREDQMRGALQSYEEAEERRAEALATWLAIQEDVRQIDPQSETTARMGQINTLESEKQRLELVLQSRLNVDRPSEVQVQSLRDQIANIDVLIMDLRDQLVGGTGEQVSLAARNTELRTAEENYSFQTAMVQQALTQMETARIEANRQVRYLSQSVRPVIPDQATYPRAFENTILAFLIFSGIYLMVSITASILREQVSS
ncbi:capsular polysaccharide transport system permease protein [Yoonia maricola]|uniref:Capsular polysaccharide transport system permease protein n=1 Tax=Yoonia maricola TaxID=420999 RepID=A0A2M8WPN8_9RHOB|nr:capsule biosynthesis protein [Yoonia maricola]PJI92900.1 capsular polysaccharide transport system permease protein [Yoonia maricola]